VDEINSILKEILGDPGGVRTWLIRSLIPALLIVAIGVIVARLIRRSLRAFLGKSRIHTDPLLSGFFLQAIYSLILVLSLITALSKAGVPVETFIAGLGITGIVIAFCLKDTLSNLAAGLFLLIYRPFRAGETIEVEGSKGTVEELTVVNMQMTTTDGVRVIMPNSKVLNAKITNYSVVEERRIELIIKVPRRDAERAIEIINRLIKEEDRILKAPAPAASVSSLAESGATLTVWAWTRPADFQTVTNNLYLRIVGELNQANIETV